MNTYYLLRLRIGVPKTCKGLTISGPKQLSKNLPVLVIDMYVISNPHQNLFFLYQ